MSITSLTDIGNLALDLLDGGSVTDVESPTTATEELLERWLPHCRKLCLRKHPWNFAAKRANLAASSTAPAFGYTTAFPVPADFIRVLSINDNDYSYDNFPTDNYGFENNMILTGEGVYASGDVLRLVYIYDFTDIPRMDPMFIDLWVHETALQIAYKITQTNTNVERIATLQKDRTALAMAIDGQERPPRRVQRSKSLNARRGNNTSHRIIF